MGLFLMGIDNRKTGGPKPEVFPTDDLRNYKLGNLYNLYNPQPYF